VASLLLQPVMPALAIAASAPPAANNSAKGNSGRLYLFNFFIAILILKSKLLPRERERTRKLKCRGAGSVKLGYRFSA
jgi:hypothetical protein